MSDLSQITAVILAGGLGTRLRQVVPDHPKVMVEINGQPFVYYLLDQLVETEIERVIISTGYKAEIIEKNIGPFYKDKQINYSREEEPLGTGGALKLATQTVDSKWCLVMNGDSYTKFDPILLLMNHKNSDANITIVIKKVEDSSRYGSIEMNAEHEIVCFKEKESAGGPGLMNAGVYLIEMGILDKIPNKTPCSLEYDFFPSMIGKGIYGFEIDSKFIDIGTPKSYAQAEKFFGGKTLSA
jgi:NDP-sugar pyrophosphorylase family protein